MDAMINSPMGRKAIWGLKEALVFKQDVSHRNGKIRGKIQVIGASVRNNNRGTSEFKELRQISTQY